MKNSKFNSLFQEAYDRYTNGNGFLVGDVVKLKSGYENNENFKKLGENVKERIKYIIKTGNNIRVGRLHNDSVASRYSAEGSGAAPANLADCYEEYAPGAWRNLVTIPVECLEEINTGADLASVPDGQKDTEERVSGPTEFGKHKWHKGKAVEDQNELGKKQNWIKKGDYKLAEKNTKPSVGANSYNDELPPKVKGLEKAKELKESTLQKTENALDSLYIKILNEDVGTMSGGVGSPDGNQLAGGAENSIETEYAPAKNPNEGPYINGKHVDLSSVELDNVDLDDPDYSSAMAVAAVFMDGTPLDPTELDELNQDREAIQKVANEFTTSPTTDGDEEVISNDELDEAVCPICGKNVCACKKEAISEDISFKAPKKTFLPGGDVNDPASAIKASKFSHHGS